MAVNRIWEGVMKIVPESRFVGEGCPINHPECGYEAIKLDFQYETSQKFHEPGRYSTSYQEEPAPQYQGFSEPPRFQQTSIVDNSILGSGNFEILKGGTFYDKNDYRQYRWVENVGVKCATNLTFASFFSHNTRPQSYGYGQNDIFQNFRDFADIKKENSRPGGRYNSYY